MTLQIRRSIIVRGNVIGFHKWPNAPDEVKFLRDLHRHVFRAYVQIEVEHNQRQHEFFTVQKVLNEQLGMLPIKREDDSDMSCEQIAQRLFGNFTSLNFPVFKVLVSEDGENAAVFERIYQ